MDDNRFTRALARRVETGYNMKLLCPKVGSRLRLGVSRVDSKIGEDPRGDRAGA